ncbi:MAG: hypothetical protein IKV99_03690, partial [Oscillospiraceae bacterium]|nr:hypothetical protein [Oscillospiraceae bacterium]
MPLSLLIKLPLPKQRPKGKVVLLAGEGFEPSKTACGGFARLRAFIKQYVRVLRIHRKEMAVTKKETCINDASLFGSDKRASFPMRSTRPNLAWGERERGG